MGRPDLSDESRHRNRGPILILYEYDNNVFQMTEGLHSTQFAIRRLKYRGALSGDIVVGMRPQRATLGRYQEAPQPVLEVKCRRLTTPKIKRLKSYRPKEKYHRRRPKLKARRTRKH